jgi:hypothetical protein
MTNTNSKLAALFTLALVLAAGSSQAADLDDKHAWTTPGSVGIVESGEVNLHLGMANVTAAMVVMEGSMNDSSTAILASFDSDLVADDGTPPHKFRVATAPMVEGRGELDFQNNVYYLEVWLTKNGSSRIGPGFGGATLSVANP